MTAAELLEAVRARGAIAYLCGDDVYLEPADALTPELLATLRQHKAEIRAYLRRQENSGVGPWQPPGRVAPPRQCVRCGGGLQMGDPDNGVCSTCRYYFSTIEPRRVM